MALTKRRHADVVLGPAVDGDYYLIGLNRHRPGLFTDTRLPPDFGETVSALLDQSHNAGAFRLRIAAPGWALR